MGFTRFSFLGSLGAAIASSTRKMVNEAKNIGISGNIKGDTRQLGGMLIVKQGIYLNLWLRLYLFKF